jgi:hypothetical protein
MGSTLPCSVTSGPANSLPLGEMIELKVMNRGMNRGHFAHSPREGQALHGEICSHTLSTPSPGVSQGPEKKPTTEEGNSVTRKRVSLKGLSAN